MNNFDRYLKAEDRLQIAVTEYVAYRYPDLKVHHSPNEGKRTTFEQYLLKKMCVSSGFPDLFICGRGKVLVLELKAGKNKPTPNQEAWLLHLRECGIHAEWSNDFELIVKLLATVFGPSRVKM